jgi:hypothetical protein
VSRAASTEPSTKKSLHFDHPNHDEESTALLLPPSNLQHPFPHESRPTPLPAMMWRFPPLHPPEAADNSPLLPQIDINSIELWRQGEGELFVSLASYFDRNSPSCLLISPLLQLPPQI